jgi:hypothetical protein
VIDALLLAAASAATLSPEELFLSACVQGQVRLDRAVAEKIEWTVAPQSLRRRQTNFSGPQIFRIRKPQLSFLIVGTDAYSPDMRRCAVASRKVNGREVWDALVKFGFPKGAMPGGDLENTISTLTYEASNGEDINVTVGFDRLADGMRYVQTITGKRR